VREDATRVIHWRQLRDSDTISHSSHHGWMVTRDGETIQIAMYPVPRGWGRHDGMHYLRRRYARQVRAGG
jgi:hypothetical protein